MLLTRSLITMFLLLFATTSGLADEADLSDPKASAAAMEAVVQILERVRSHDFHPLDNRAFTADRRLRKHGIADLNDKDWQVRLMTVRDLTRAGKEALPAVIKGLDDTSVQVRYLCATALGAQRAAIAVPDLRRVLEKDGEAIVRSQAAVALGQIGDKAALPTLRERQVADSSKDVQHQCELSIDQIEKGKFATEELLKAYRDLDPKTFESVRVGAPAPDFTLPDAEGRKHRLSEQTGKDWVVLIWVFADWCPVCHGEFRELIQMRDAFAKAGVKVFTVETHDTYRARVMVGREVDPKYWFAKESFQKAYTEQIWWPHLVDRAGAVGAIYGVDPMAFAVHAEYINRPSTIIIDPAGTVRFAYYGTYWGDRPSIEQTLKMIEAQKFDFEHRGRLKNTKTQK